MSEHSLSNRLSRVIPDFRRGRSRNNWHVIDAYLADLSAELRGPRRKRRDVLAEVRDSLDDAAEHFRAEGASPAEAERLAVAEFGTVAQIAPAFQAELGYAQQWRTALLVILVIAPQGRIWDNDLRPEGDPGLLLRALREMEQWLGTAVLLAAFVLLVVSRLGVRRLGVRPAITRATGLAGLTMAAVVTAIGMTMTAMNTAHRTLLDPMNLPWAIAFLVIPMTLVALSSRRCLQYSRTIGS